MKGCRVITDSEVKQVLDTMDIREKVLFLTGLNFGTRISESLSLTFGQVAGEYLQVKSKKNSDNVTFPIPANYKELVSELKAKYESQGVKVNAETFLFLSRKGENNPISRIQASRIITAACKALGIDGKVNTHSFRKAFVTKIYELTGRDIIQTKMYSRHKNLSNLEYYIKTTDSTGLINQLSWGG